MSIVKNLVSGTNFDPDSLTALQKVTLRAVVMSFLFYGLAALEGTLMRIALINPEIPPINGSPEHFFSIMTVHPIVGIFGSTYQLVFAAFMFLIPFLTKKPLYSIGVANFVWIFIMFDLIFMIIVFIFSLTSHTDQ